MYKLLPQSKSHVHDDFSKHPASSDEIPAPYFLQDVIFAAGSFWDLEAAFDRVEGVVRTAAGYYGGNLVKPSYKQVLESNTGHTEAVKVIFDKRKTSFKSLCQVFWESHDPTNKDYLNFGDSTHHRSAIFYGDEGEKKQAQESKVRQQMKLNRRIVTKILPRNTTFFLAESHHQKYFLQRDHIKVCECLGLRSAEHFFESYLACRLNGLLSREGEGAAADLNNLLAAHQLTSEMRLTFDAIMQGLAESQQI